MESKRSETRRGWTTKNWKIFEESRQTNVHYEHTLITKNKNIFPDAVKVEITIREV